jgi:hypothetical protein
MRHFDAASREVIEIKRRLSNRGLFALDAVQPGWWL